MLTVNSDIKYCLTNDQMRIFKHFEIIEDALFIVFSWGNFLLNKLNYHYDCHRHVLRTKVQGLTLTQAVVIFELEK